MSDAIVRWTTPEERPAAEACKERLLAGGWRVIGKRVLEDGSFGCYTLRRPADGQAVAKAVVRPVLRPEFVEATRRCQERGQALSIPQERRLLIPGSAYDS